MDHGGPATRTGGTPAAEPRRLALNFLYLSGGEFTAKLLAFASFTYLARVLGPPDYGLVEFTLAVMVFFTLPVDLGLSSYGAREIARNPDAAARLLHEITGLRVILTLCSMLGLGVFILVIQESFEVKILLALYGVSLLPWPFMLLWFFQGHERMHWVGIASLVRQTVFAAVVFMLCRPGTPLKYIGWGECLAETAVAIFCIAVARRRFGVAWPSPDFRADRLIPHLKQAAPIGLTELAWACMWYFCTVLLGFLHSGPALGWFGASHRTLMALNTFVYLYFFNLLPSISRCVALPRSHLLGLMDRSIRFAGWTGLIVAALLTALAPHLLGLLYGANYKAASGSFAILVWMLPVTMISGHHRYALIAYNRQGWLFVCTALSAAAAVLLGFALEPAYGGTGAACALLIASGLNLALVYVAVERLVVRMPVFRPLASPLAALALSIALYAALARWNIWVALPGGCAAYLAVWGTLEAAQLTTLLRAISRKTAS
jgi:O-antigen/teichoic acid export membrane protein